MLVQHQPFDLGVFLEQVQDERITYTVAPPAVLALLLQHEEMLAHADISSLRQIGSGSVPLQEWMVRGWHDRHGITIINFFGSNEGISLMTDVKLMTDPAQRARFFPRYGAGREWSFPASRTTSIKLVDPATGTEIDEPGKAGELRLKGPSLFAGYVNGANLASPFDEDGYLKTGDMFVIDGPNNEFLRYVDRAKDVIIRGGMNIAPAELETMIASQPDVAEVAVVGYPDDVLGEKVCAYRRAQARPDRDAAEHPRPPHRHGHRVLQAAGTPGSCERSSRATRWARSSSVSYAKKPETKRGARRDIDACARHDRSAGRPGRNRDRSREGVGPSVRPPSGLTGCPRRRQQPQPFRRRGQPVHRRPRRRADPRERWRGCRRVQRRH